MMRKHVPLARMGLLALALVAAGCGEDAPVTAPAPTVGGDRSLDEIDLNQDYGGLAWTDEAPAFGDAQLAEEAAAADRALSLEDDEAAVLAADPSLAEAPGLRRTVLRILWGRLEGDPRLDLTPAEWSPVDWSGRIEVDGAVLAVKRTILFERPGDHLLPRESRRVLAWTSHTAPHVDGLLLCILQRPDSTGAYPEGELRFSTGPYSATFSLDELADLEATTPVDEVGNAITFEGRRLDGCPAGMLRGYWVHGPQQEGGFLRALWADELGRITGHLLGRWGWNDEGRPVFAGKIIGREGRIRALVQGEWEAREEGGGVFHGHWATQGGGIEGGLRGEYRAHPDLPGLGFLRGGWRAVCEEGPADPPS